MIAILIVLWAVPILACVVLGVRLLDVEARETLTARSENHGGRLSEHAETLEMHAQRILKLEADFNQVAPYLSDRITALETRATFKPPKAPAKKPKRVKP